MLSHFCSTLIKMYTPLPPCKLVALFLLFSSTSEEFCAEELKYEVITCSLTCEQLVYSIFLSALLSLHEWQMDCLQSRGPHIDLCCFVVTLGEYNGVGSASFPDCRPGER